MIKRWSFAEFLDEVESEARLEGPASVAQLEILRQRYHLAGQLAMLRKRRRLSQPDLAKRSGLQQADISKIERGLANPTEETLVRLACALGVRLALTDKRTRMTVG